jgi:hypothetical protein
MSGGARFFRLPSRRKCIVEKRKSCSDKPENLNRNGGRQSILIENGTPQSNSFVRHHTALPDETVIKFKRQRPQNSASDAAPTPPRSLHLPLPFPNTRKTTAVSESVAAPNAAGRHSFLFSGCLPDPSGTAPLQNRSLFLSLVPRLPRAARGITFKN